MIVLAKDVAEKINLFLTAKKYMHKIIYSWKQLILLLNILTCVQKIVLFAQTEDSICTQD